MALWRRRDELPGDLRERAGLATGGRRGERVLATARLADGWAVATTARLVVLGDDVATLTRRWADVDGARLDPETGEITVTWVDGTPPAVLALADQRDPRLARAVHERVQSSVVHSETVTVRGDRKVRVVLRRAADGALFTQVIGPGDVDLAEPGTAATVAAAERRVREAAGLS